MLSRVASSAILPLAFASGCPGAATGTSSIAALAALPVSGGGDPAPGSGDPPAPPPPTGNALLSSSKLTKNQAFRFKTRLFGFQIEPDVGLRPEHLLLGRRLVVLLALLHQIRPKRRRRESTAPVIPTPKSAR